MKSLRPWSIALLILIVFSAFAIGRCSGAPAKNAAQGDTSDANDPHADHDHAKESTEYICPMHPQIRQPEFGTCPICMMDLVPVSAGGEESVIDIAQFSDEAAALLELETTTIQRAPQARRIRTWGQVVSASSAEARVSAWASGRIERLYVNADGQTLKAGDRVAQLWSPALASAVQTIRDAEASGPSLRAVADGARQQLRNAGLSAREIDALVASENPTPRITLRAHHGGTVRVRHVQEGDYVQEGDPIVSLTNTERLWAELDVLEDDLSALRVGQKVSLQQRSGAAIADAAITFIAPTIDAVTRSATVRVEWTSEAATTLPGTRVYAEIHVESERSLLTVPKDAVLWTGERSVVFVVDRTGSPPIYQPTEVSLGERWGDQVVVLEGVYLGEEIVSQGAFRIDATLYLRTGGGMLRGHAEEGEVSHEH